MSAVTGTDKIHHSLRPELERSAVSGYEEGPHVEGAQNTLMSLLR